MTREFEIKDSDELIKYLEKRGKDIITDVEYQLQTNYGLIYKLENGEVVFLPSDFNGSGFIFRDDNIFKNILESDHFPIEEESQTIFDSETERIKNISNEVDYYREHLNKTLKFNFREISKEAAHAYLKKAVGRKIKKLTTDKDIIALIAVFGELIRKEVNGKWFVIKHYGKYNPYFEPNILTQKNKVIMISSIILGNIKWRVTTLESIFNKGTIDGINGGLDYDHYCRKGNCTILP